MIVAVPKEIKTHEYRVALVPAGVESLTKAGHLVLVEEEAGVGSGFSDEAYRRAGAEVVGREECFSRAELLVKVKEPLPEEITLLREGHVVFTFFHFAASQELTEAVLGKGVVAIAYETVQTGDGVLPLLVPMSEVAGRMAVQEGAKCLEKFMGGRGVLLSGVPGVAPGEVVILGGGVVGSNSARIAAGLGAQVTVLDISLPRLRYLAEVMPPNVHLLHSNPHTIRASLRRADLLIGAVLLPGAKAPRLVAAEDLRLMREGAVIVDVSVDQGGCVETCRPTTHDDPTYVEEGVLHYCVANMPGAVPRTSTLALTSATFPYVQELATYGWVEACRRNGALSRGVNIAKREITHPAVAEAFGRPAADLAAVLGA